jgi:hypothetical protein
MNRRYRRCVCPAIDAVHYHCVWCFPDEFRGIGGCHCRHFLRAVVHRGARGSRRFLGFRPWKIDGAIVPQYVEQESTGKSLRVMRLGRSMVAMMIGE